MGTGEGSAWCGWEERSEGQPTSWFCCTSGRASPNAFTTPARTLVFKELFKNIFPVFST